MRKKRKDITFQTRRSLSQLHITALQQLDEAGFVTKYKNKGRVVTPKGRSFIDSLSGEILKESIKSNPAIAEYR